MKKYLISLEKDKQRRELFFSQPNTADFEVFFAVNSMDKSEQELQSAFNFTQFQQRYQRTPARGEVGCTLSHCAIYQKILADEQIQDDEYTLICEDDALFTVDFQQKLTALLPELDADIVWVGQSKIADFADSELTINYPIAGGKNIAGLQYAFPYKPYFAGTVAYLIRKSAVEKLINFTAIPFWLADDFILFETELGIQAKAIRPLLAIENPKTISNLSQFRADKYNNWWLKLIKYPMKKLYAIKRNIA